MATFSSFPVSVRDYGTPDNIYQEYLNEVLHGKTDTRLLRLQAARLGGTFRELTELQTGLKILSCDKCNQLCFARESRPVYYGAYQVCDICIVGYTYCKSCNTFILVEDLESQTHEHEHHPVGFSWPEEEENLNVFPFDADIMQSKHKTFYSTNKEPKLLHPRYFGVELEVEKIKAGPFKLDQRTSHIIDQNFFMLKHDGSLSKKGKGGFEIVTMPGTLAFHKDGIWDRFFNECSQFFEVAPPTSSLHVHFSTDSVTEGVLGKISEFVNNFENREFLANIAHRELGVPNPNGKVYMRLYPDMKASQLLIRKNHKPNCPWHPKNVKVGNRYALNKDRSIRNDGLGNPILVSMKESHIIVRPTCKCGHGDYLFDDHYAAFNLKTKRQTAELRIFRGIVKKGFLYAAIEFTDALINFCSDNAPSGLLFQNFIDWFCISQKRYYPNLAKLLAIRGWIEPPKPRSNLGLERSSDYDGLPVSDS